MASLTKEEKEKMVWLHVEHINGRTKLVDQDGREVGGVIDFELIAGVNKITEIKINAESSSRDLSGEITINIGA